MFPIASSFSRLSDLSYDDSSHHEQVTPDETSDDEGDMSISPVETADFEDHSSSSGESKRGGLGTRKGTLAEVNILHDYG